MATETRESLQARAQEIRDLARKYNLRVTARDGIVAVRGSFDPGDVTAYREMEENAHRILRRFRATRPGSTWGTDSGSVGGHVGLQGGYVQMNKSGCDRRLAKLFEN